MLTDSERFAFTFRTIHSFETSGNAYDGTMTSDKIATGDLIIVPSEHIVGIAHAYPVAVTAACGVMHGFDGDREAFGNYCDEANMPEGTAAAAIALAAALGYPLDPQFAAATPSADEL